MTAPPALEIVAPGAYASLQDLGRRGYRRVGVPWAGVLDARLMRIANALVGNAEGTPVIECFDGGLQLAARGGRLRLAVAGDAVVEVECAGERRLLAAWRSLTLDDGDVLRVRRLERGRIAVVALEGLALPLVLGSASTYARAALGGIDGRALTAGARLPATPASERLEQMLPGPPRPGAGPVRVVAGPQADHFAPDTRAAFTDTDYRVSTDADRMGVRLDGPALAHLGAREIVSDATVPGSIQVPGNGQPIVLLADAQTAGGYPKIGTVIGADLPRLAASRPGQVLRFAWVDATEGERLARVAEADLKALLSTLRPLLDGGVDLAALYACNLVSGMVNSLSPDEPVA
jgi:allophanate hydrolase